MAMLQYRHKSRAWRQMVTTDTEGNVRAIKDQIALGIAEAEQGAYDPESDLNALMERLALIRSRLERRVSGLPDPATLRAHLERLSGQMLHTLLVSEPWTPATSAERRSTSSGFSMPRPARRWPDLPDDGFPPALRGPGEITGTGSRGKLMPDGHVSIRAGHWYSRVFPSVRSMRGHTRPTDLFPILPMSGKFMSVYLCNCLYVTNGATIVNSAL